MSQAEVYFVPPGLECDVFLQWKISLIPPAFFIHPMEKKKKEFAFLCILLRIPSFSVTSRRPKGPNVIYDS